MSPKDPSEQGWQQLGAVRGDELAAARDEAHWALQLLSAVGYTHIERMGDDSQSNSGWVDGMQILVGRRIEVEPASFASLSPARMVVALHEPGGDALEELECDGSTLDECYTWLSGAIARRYGTDAVPLVRPGYEMALGGGEKFGASSAQARAELARWFHDANLVMRDFRAKTPGATLPRVWPHHFDMGMLVSLEEDGNTQDGRSIGIGLAPGDASIPEPYWYVNPYPAPGSDLPDPSIGRWNRDGFTGLILDTNELLAADDQEQICRSFIDEAVATCRAALGS